MNRKKNIRLIQNRLLNKELWYIIKNNNSYYNEYFIDYASHIWYKQIFSKNGKKGLYGINSKSKEYYE